MEPFSRKEYLSLKMPTEELAISDQRRITLALETLGYENALLFSVEGWPNFENVLEELKERKIKNVTMMPLMMVAGDHAMNDMAGDEEDSFKSMLIKEGFKVKTYLHGLGENIAVQNLFVKKASQAWEALQAEK